MFTRLFSLIDLPLPEDPGIGVELASAALLMEIVFADYKRGSEEIEAAKKALRASFSLPEEELQAVLNKAEELHGDAVSIHPFIEAINEEFDDALKYQLIVNLWRVAMADGELDKFEQHYIRKIAELLYVPHTEFIRAKLQVFDDIDSRDSK
ncbi:MAG: TerB family tellurite resistance protein [Pseudomonadales bacterium]